MTGNDVLLRVDDSQHEDAEGAARWGRQLYQELWIADVAPPDRVRLDLNLTGQDNSRPASSGKRLDDGSRSDRAVPGTVVVDLLSRDSLADLVGCMREWAARIGRTVHIVLDGDTLAVTGALDDRQDAAIEAFLARHVSSGT